MYLNYSCNGFQNEDNFVKEMRYKKFKDIRYSIQLFLIDLFGEIDNNELIICWKNDTFQKFDILIKIKDVTKRVSLKKGIKNSIHSEPISEFIHFLMESNMPRELVMNFLRYHYADDTTNGTGKERLDIETYKKDHQIEIDEINKFINNEIFLKKCIERFIVYGRNSYQPIDAIILGIVEDFIYIKTENIYKIIIQKKDIYSTAIHFGPLTYQPMNRCLNGKLKYDSKRFISQIKWYNILDDIIESMNNSLVYK